MGIETLSTDRELKNIFMEKSCRKCASKASPRPLFNFAKWPKTLWARNSLKKILPKSLKKVYFFFRIQSVSQTSDTYYFLQTSN